MIEHGTIFTVSMVILISLLTMLSDRIRVAYPILLVLAGLLDLEEDLTKC